MYINQAIQKAFKEHCGISRRDDHEMIIFPTTTFCGLIIVGRGATPANDKAAVRWQPSADDLLANDWVLSH